MRSVRVCILCLAAYFFLGCHEGYIALWKSGSPVPQEVYPYRADLLPPADQKALNEGIMISDEQELVRLLEDFMS